jgi:gliding motility-associated-like protein
MNTLKTFQTGTKDSARWQAARVVDSIIQANAIIDNQLAQQNEQITANNDQVEDVQVTDPSVPVVSGTEPIIIIPKAFTPNADGLNDVLYIDGLEFYPDNTFVVHNSKGEIVYTKKEYKGEWNADGVPDGIYIYFLTYKNLHQVTITIKGVVTIIR